MVQCPVPSTTMALDALGLLSRKISTVLKGLEVCLHSSIELLKQTRMVEFDLVSERMDDYSRG